MLEMLPSLVGPVSLVVETKTSPATIPNPTSASQQVRPINSASIIGTSGRMDQEPAP